MSVVSATAVTSAILWACVGDSSFGSPDVGMDSSVREDGGSTDTGGPIDDGAASGTDGDAAAGPDGAADSGTDADAAAAPFYVFVTAPLYKGNFGGLTAGDAICQDAANAFHLTGTYGAWLSDQTTSAKDRLSTSWDGPWVRRSDGATVAANRAAFAGGGLSHAIGSGDPASVWTGTTSDGTKEAANTCGNWMSANTLTTGKAGTPTDTASTWTDDGNSNCNNLHSLYCLRVE